MIKKTIDIVIAVAKQGGVETVINIVAEYLEQQSYNVRLIQMVYEGDEWYYNKEKFFYLHTNRNNNTDRSFIDAYKDFISQNDKPDVIIATGWPVLVWVCKNVCANLNLNTKVISWTHNDINRYVANNYGGNDFLVLADINLVLTQQMYQQVKAYNPKAIVYNIGNPVEVREDFTLSAINSNSLVYVGRLDKNKHVDVIIKALAQCNSNWNLTIIGDGANKESLIELSNQVGVFDKILWTGWKENPREYLNNYYAYVIASESEGFCVAAIEASERGLPVISTPVGILPEYIIPGYNGYLFEIGNFTMLAQILDYIAEEKLPRLSRVDCHNSILKYEKNVYLETLKRIIDQAID
jgi:UDP-D-galactose:(glucosyl)LPS alpha-1,6-D-galactosyltransferase